MRTRDMVTYTMHAPAYERNEPEVITVSSAHPPQYFNLTYRAHQHHFRVRHTTQGWFLYVVAIPMGLRFG